MSPQRRIAFVAMSVVHGIGNERVDAVGVFLTRVHVQNSTVDVLQREEYHSV